MPCGSPAYAPRRQASDGAYHVPRIADSAVVIRDASPFRVRLSRSCAKNDVLLMWTRATRQRASWPWPNSRFGHSVLTRVRLTVHIRYPVGTSLASRPPSCWQSPCMPSRAVHATEVGDVVGWASHRPVTSPACHRRLLLVVQQVMAWRWPRMTRQSKTSSLIATPGLSSRDLSGRTDPFQGCITPQLGKERHTCRTHISTLPVLSTPRIERAPLATYYT